MTHVIPKRLWLTVTLLGVLVVAAVALGAIPAFADHESTHLRCPNDQTRFTPNCGDQVTGTVTGTTLPRTAGADGELTIIALALIGIGVVLQRRWVLARAASSS